MLNYTNNNDTSVISLFFVSFLIPIFFPENLVRLIFTFKIWRRQFVVGLQQLHYAHRKKAGISQMSELMLVVAVIIAIILA